MTTFSGIKDLKIIHDPKVTLVYPPVQSWPGMACKPNGSLAYPNLGGALIEAGVHVEVFDACVGNDKDKLEEVFYQSKMLPNGLARTGVSDHRILDEVKDSDVVGLTSIFTEQESMVLSTARLIKDAYPDKLIVAGGVNARSRLEKFLTNGIDIVCLSEAENTFVKILDMVRKGSRDFSDISAVAVRTGENILVNKAQPNDVVWDLDQLPMPAWHLLPNERYWAVGRPHGGQFKPNEPLRYASMMTSMGCIFKCSYCHIAGETEDSVSGAIGRFRIKSDERVLAELDQLKMLGVKQVFIEDDTLFGIKGRAIRLLRKIRGADVDILDVNGVNLIHLFKGSEPDKEVIEALVEAGFKEISLPFESASQRIIKRYATNKFDAEKHNVKALIHLCKEYGLRIEGNYMVGWPYETREEINQTIEMARWHRQEGLDGVAFMCVMPLPGTPLFDQASDEGLLSPDWNPDKMNWMKSNIINPNISTEELEELRQNAWLELNDAEFVKSRLGMVVTNVTE